MVKRVEKQLPMMMSDTINTLGAGHAIFETLTNNVDSCGVVNSYPCKILTGFAPGRDYDSEEQQSSIPETTLSGKDSHSDDVVSW